MLTVNALNAQKKLLCLSLFLFCSELMGSGQSSGFTTRQVTLTDTVLLNTIKKYDHNIQKKEVIVIGVAKRQECPIPNATSIKSPINNSPLKAGSVCVADVYYLENAPTVFTFVAGPSVRLIPVGTKPLALNNILVAAIATRNDEIYQVVRRKVHRVHHDLFFRIAFLKV